MTPTRSILRSAIAGFACVGLVTGAAAQADAVIACVLLALAAASAASAVWLR